MPKDTVVMAFSLSPEASAYIRGAGRGRRSAMVNRCILYYKDNRVEELIEEIEFMRANIQGLQNRILAHGQTQELEAEKGEISRFKALGRALLHFGLGKRRSK